MFLFSINESQLRRRYQFSNVSRVEEAVRAGALRFVWPVEVSMSHFTRLYPYSASGKGLSVLRNGGESFSLTSPLDLQIALVQKKDRSRPVSVVP